MITLGFPLKSGSMEHAGTFFIMVWYIIIVVILCFNDGMHVRVLFVGRNLASLQNTLGWFRFS